MLDVCVDYYTAWVREDFKKMDYLVTLIIAEIPIS